MAMLLLGLAGLAVLIIWWFMRSPAPRAAAPRPPVTRPFPSAPSPLPSSPAPLAAPSAATAPAPIADEPAPPPPPALQLRVAEVLEPARTEQLLEALRKLPRPPRALQQLMAPQFVQTATSAELAGIVMGEPSVAARVVATANSPMYALHQPVTSVGQAITFLGLSSVRQMCLQHMLADCFQPKDAAQQREFDVLWRASSIAGELCQQLAQRLRLPEPASLVTLLVLSFLGRQAGAALLDVAEVKGMDTYQRALHEQEVLGLASHELGHLLMRAWEVPLELADDARTLSALHFDAGRFVPPDRETALVLGSLCAMLGERIARDQIGAALYDPVHDTRPDMAALRPRLSRPPLNTLGAEFSSQALVRVLSRLMNTPSN